MKPIIQRALDALEARIRALEVLPAKVAAIITSIGVITSSLALLGPGRLIGHQVLSGSSGIYVPTAGTNAIWVRGIGGGGGGGGANSSLGFVAAGGSGNSGWFGEFTLFDVSGTGSFTNGAGGTAGVSDSSNGGTGGSGTFTFGGITWTLVGGAGGSSSTGGTVGIAGTGVQPSNSSAGPFDSVAYEPSSVASWWNGSFAYSEAGAASPYGAGGIALGPVTQDGKNGMDGAGASGGVAITPGIANGGTGGPGTWRIHEFS